jgi:hypothetical protein
MRIDALSRPSSDAAAPMLVRGMDTTPQRWRNGGGWTRELLAWPDATDWQVRISVADVESDGPFSAFPGVRRWFAVLEGGGVELTVDGTSRRLAPADPAFAFDGAAATSARLLDGPTRDLNLMLRGIDGALHAAAEGVAWAPTRRHAGVYAARRLCFDHDGRRADVAAGALLWFATAPRSLRIELPSESNARMEAAPAAWWIEAGALLA